MLGPADATVPDWAVTSCLAVSIEGADCLVEGEVAKAFPDHLDSSVL